MKKIINNPKDTKSQMIEGILYTYDHILEGVPHTGIIRSRDMPKNKVAIISGGGSGHEPADSGYVGKGMLDACICGPIFEPPSVEEILQAIELSDQGKGVLLIVKNFEKDLNVFTQAQKQAIEKGHLVEQVVVNDDCSIDTDNFKKRRRGVAATVFVQKILGAASQEISDLKALKALGEAVVYNTNTLGVALSPASFIDSDRKGFTLQEDEIYFGIGIHGEPGYRKEPFHSSERLAIELVNKLKNQFHFKKNENYALMINGLGATPLLELFVFTNDVRRLLELEGISVCFKKVGNYMTSNDMAGLSLTLLKIKEEKWLEYLNAPVACYGW